MFDVIAQHVILHVQKVLPFEVLLEGRNVKHGRTTRIIAHHVIS